MKAISIRQPWAWAILYAGKDIENRSWRTRYRGPVLIHAARGMTLKDYESAACFIAERTGLLAPRDLHRGGIVGMAELVDCVNRSESPWFFGPWGFVLHDARPLPFAPWRGELGLFEAALGAEAGMITPV